MSKNLKFSFENHRDKQVHCQSTAHALLRSLCFQICVSWAASQPPAVLTISASAVLLCSNQVPRILRDPWDYARALRKWKLGRMSGCRSSVPQNNTPGPPALLQHVELFINRVIQTSPYLMLYFRVSCVRFSRLVAIL